MKSILIIIAILSTALQSATADGEVGRYQLVVAHVDSDGGTTETLYRIDTATGETCRLMHATLAIPEAKQSVAKIYRCEGWAGIPKSIQEAITDGQRAIDEMPDKRP